MRGRELRLCVWYTYVVRKLLHKHLARAIMAGLWATALYAVVLHSYELLELYTLAPMYVPAFCYDYWAVFPGAVLLSFVVLWLARGSARRGALVGGLLAPLNAPFAVLLVIVAWEVQARMGLVEPWIYGFEGLWGEWIYQLKTITLAGIPVAVPCGALMGAWLAKGDEDV
jgi:hypothetical protein